MVVSKKEEDLYDLVKPALLSLYSNKMVTNQIFALSPYRLPV